MDYIFIQISSSLFQSNSITFNDDDYLDSPFNWFPPACAYFCNILIGKSLSPFCIFLCCCWFDFNLFEWRVNEATTNIVVGPSVIKHENLMWPDPKIFSIVAIQWKTILFLVSKNPILASNKLTVCVVSSQYTHFNSTRPRSARQKQKKIKL